ncbi:hypothetical protein [Kitasatospora cineracea]|uniref:Uncharacterized protein n=1 Tax=Kitasatospora cineracea TaxID=88074 RepID=A0A3N4R7J9_9ACTN|nr:hypothetical protein [Kitasatospora cineracea]RPE26591.1 hypothetical protein EDD38_7652 [Kitasatospora cineracea]
MGSRKTDPAEVARQGAEAVRELNHQTLNAKTMSAPEISATVRGLLDLVDRLPQALEQLAGHLERELAAGRVRMEDGRDPAGPVDQALAGLRRAAALTAPENHTDYGDPAGELSEALHDAGSWLFNMGAPWSDDETEDGER